MIQYHNFSLLTTTTAICPCLCPTTPALFLPPLIEGCGPLISIIRPPDLSQGIKASNTDDERDGEITTPTNKWRRVRQILRECDEPTSEPDRNDVDPSAESSLGVQALIQHEPSDS